MNHRKIIPALDCDFDTARAFVEKSGDIYQIYKIHSLFFEQNYKIVDFLKEQNKEIFLDLKLHDIPKTMCNHILALAKLKVNYITIYLANSTEALDVVVRTCLKNGITPIGVSVLTSMNVGEIGVGSGASEQVLRLVKHGFKSGIKHFVCSAFEALLIKKIDPNIITVVPGVVLSVNELEYTATDQKRIVSLDTAWKNQADWVVMGRSLIN